MFLFSWMMWVGRWPRPYWVIFLLSCIFLWSCWLLAGPPAARCIVLRGVGWGRVWAQVQQRSLLLRVRFLLHARFPTGLRLPSLALDAPVGSVCLSSHACTVCPHCESVALIVTSFQDSAANAAPRGDQCTISFQDFVQCIQQTLIGTVRTACAGEWC
jgi:hypothetical protein